MYVYMRAQKVLFVEGTCIRFVLGEFGFVAYVCVGWGVERNEGNVYRIFGNAICVRYTWIESRALVRSVLRFSMRLVSIVYSRAAVLILLFRDIYLHDFI